MGRATHRGAALAPGPGPVVCVPLTEAAAGDPGTAPGRVLAAGPAGVSLDVDGQQRDFGYQELGPGQVQIEFGGAGAWACGPLGDEGEPDGH